MTTATTSLTNVAGFAQYESAKAKLAKLESEAGRLQEKTREINSFMDRPILLAGQFSHGFISQPEYERLLAEHQQRIKATHLDRELGALRDREDALSAEIEAQTATVARLRDKCVGAMSGTASDRHGKLVREILRRLSETAVAIQQLLDFEEELRAAGFEGVGGSKLNFRLMGIYSLPRQIEELLLHAAADGYISKSDIPAKLRRASLWRAGDRKRAVVRT